MHESGENLLSMVRKKHQPVTSNPVHPTKPVPVSIGQKEPGLNRRIDCLINRHSLLEQFCNLTQTEVKSISKPEIRREPEQSPIPCSGGTGRDIAERG
jgi:hypothetical protein